jgi:hypothetical protein
MFENKILRMTFGPKTEEVLGGWEYFHNVQLRDLYAYTSPNIIRVIESRRVSWDVQVAGIGYITKAYCWKI